MRVKAMKWLDSKLELTKINNEWARVMIDAQKYQWKPEFLWTKKEVEEVIKLLERAYDLVNEEFRIYLICGAYDKIPKCTDDMNTLDSEIWRLKVRLAS